MRRLLYASIIALVTIALVSCGDSGTGPDPGNENEETEIPTYSVSVELTPSDAGSIVPSADTTYEEGEEVEVQASPNEEYVFSGWTGDVESSENPLSVTMEQNYDLTASFKLKNYELTINKEGKGSVSEDIVEEKSKEYEHGTVVELTANPAEGYKFVEWTGDVEDTDNPVQVTVDDPKEVTAVFQKKSYPLTINTDGDGAVSEEVVQQKTTDYEYGTVVELTANPAEGSEFTKWSGDVSGSDNSMEITVEDTMEVTANFDKKKFLVSTTTTGEGTLERDPDQDEYKYDSTVEITATPKKGWEFSEWGSDASGSDNPLTITVAKNVEVSANFEEKPVYSLTTNTSGQGSIDKDPDQQEYLEGTEVELMANPDDGWSFIEWKGDFTGTENPATLTVSEQKEVTAVFEEEQAKFYLAENGVTIKCEDAEVGDTGTVDDVEYTKRSADQITTDNAPTTCTSGITDMSQMFDNEGDFNGDISHWDVSSTTNMSEMFYYAESFNGNINHWDVSAVMNMHSMFTNADAFNQDLNNWDVSNVKDMSVMFSGSPNFNGDISDWEVSSVTNMKAMFRNALSFNSDISGWEVFSVTDMSSMFSDANDFNADISGWDVLTVTDMSSMFKGANSFDQNIGLWSVSNVTDMNSMFYDADSFEHNLNGWDVSSVENMASMFRSSPFDEPLGNWDVSNVTNMENMFRSSPFNQDISNWCVDKIYSEPEGFDGIYSFTAMDSEHLPEWGPCSE